MKNTRYIFSFLLAILMLFGAYYIMDKHPDIIENFDFSEYTNIAIEKIQKLNPFGEEVSNTNNVNRLMDRITSSRERSTEKSVHDDELKTMIKNLTEKVENLEDKLENQNSNEKSLVLNKRAEALFELIGNSPIHKIDSFNSIGITFDVDSGSKNPLEILDILRRRNIQLTIFVEENWAIKYPKVINQMIYDQHEIGLLEDEDNTNLSSEYLVNRDKSLSTNYSVFTKPLFRPNSFDIDETDIDNVENAGYRLFLWSLESEDNSNTEEIILNKLKQETKPGDIVRFDLNSKKAIDTLPEYLRYLKNQNINVVKLSSLFD